MSTAEVDDLVIQVRDHYVAQFRDLVLRQQRGCKVGSPDVKFQLPPDTSAFHQFAVVDFVRNDGEPEAVIFEPESVLTLARIEGNLAETKLVIEGLRWDAIVIRHDTPRLDEALEHWWTKRFDPDEVDSDPADEFSGCIHAVYVAPGELQVDLGTAPAVAFWELLECLACGFRRCRSAIPI